MIPDCYPPAYWRPGPEWKQGYDFFTGYVNHNVGQGVVIHSAEGTFIGAMSVLDGPRQASWTLFFPKHDRPIQHYSLNAITWHCGRYGDDGGQVAGNGCLVGCEVEGEKGEPLTENQVEHLILFLGWYWQYAGLCDPTRPAKEQTFPQRPIPLILDDELWEHNEISATDCPSGRIPWQEIIRGMRMAGQSTEWERYTKGLALELAYFARIDGLAGRLHAQGLLLIAKWRRSDADPPLDHEVFKEVRALCSQLRAAVNDLEARCHIGDRGK